MKRILPVFSLAVIMVACGTEQKNNDNSIANLTAQQAPTYNPDTVGLAQFQQWKAENELAEVEEYKKPATQSIAAAPVKKVRRTYSAPISRAPQGVSYPSPSTSTSSENTTIGSSEDGVMSSESSNEAKAPEEKKGWSKAAKGATIGAGTGAAAGAVINKKNRVVGGIIGGIVGGAVGYGVGRKMDKKDGRY